MIWGFLTVAIATVAGLVLYKKWFAPHVFGAIQASRQQAVSLIDIAALLQIDRRLPSFNEWSIAPDLAVWLIEYVRDNRPRTLVELGAGTSTLVLGRSIQRFCSDSHLVAIEGKEEFARAAAHQLSEWGLDTYAEVRHSWADDWYGAEEFRDITQIDLLLIDGPAGNRYPAGPALFPKLSAHAVVILDDADRPREQAIVERWLEEFPGFVTEHVSLERGAFIIRRKHQVSSG